MTGWHERLEKLVELAQCCVPDDMGCVSASAEPSLEAELEALAAEIEAAVAVAEAYLAWVDALQDEDEQRESWHEEDVLTEASDTYRHLRDARP